MPAPINYIGRTVGGLRVLSRARMNGIAIYWLCETPDGDQVEVPHSRLSEYRPPAFIDQWENLEYLYSGE